MAKSKFTKKEIQQIKKLVKEGKSSRQIAKTVHRKLQDVQREIRRIEHRPKSKKMVRNPYGRKGKPTKVQEIVIYGIIRQEQGDHNIYKRVDYFANVITNKTYEQIQQLVNEYVPEGWITPWKTPWEIHIGVREVTVKKKDTITEKQFIKGLEKYFETLPTKKYIKKKVIANKKEQEMFKDIYDKGWYE